MHNIIKSSSQFKVELKKLIESEDFVTNESFRVPMVRDALTIDRFKNLFNSKIIEVDSKLSSEVTVEHNTDLERMFFSEMSKRPDLISYPLNSINKIRQNAGRMKVLSIGARTEAEIFSLVNIGFNLSNIECVDLFSYSPYIKIGDVHDLKYNDNSFDLLVCGWVLEFCNDIKKACSEILRVTKPDGYIAIAGMHHPISTDMKEYNKRKKHEDRIWYCSIKSIKESFNVKDSDFIFKSDIEPCDLDKRGEVIAVFKKGERNV